MVLAVVPIQALLLLFVFCCFPTQSLTVCLWLFICCLEEVEQKESVAVDHVDAAV